MGTVKPYKNRGYSLPIENGDLQGITQLCIDSLRKHKGNQAIYRIDELPRFLDDCESYFKMLHDTNNGIDADKQLYPSIESLCVFLGLARNTLNLYSQRSDAWNSAIAQVRNCIASIKIQLASHGRIPAIVHCFDMTNNYGYVNTSEFKLSAEPQQDATAPSITTAQIQGYLEASETPKLPE